MDSQDMTQDEEMITDSPEAKGDDSAIEAQDAKEALVTDHEWYIVQCFSGKEYRVQSRIEQLIEDPRFKGRLFRVLVPEEETVEIKNNKRIEKTTKIFPSYVFVQMKSDSDLGYEIRQLPGVAKFIGDKKPTPVKEDEILKVLRKVGDKTKKIDVDFEEGEVIQVISGPFRGYTGPISEINGDRGKLKAMILIFGRETPVELDFDQVEKTVK